MHKTTQQCSHAQHISADERYNININPSTPHQKHNLGVSDQRDGNGELSLLPACKGQREQTVSVHHIHHGTHKRSVPLKDWDATFVWMEHTT